MAADPYTLDQGPPPVKQLFRTIKSTLAATVPTTLKPFRFDDLDFTLEDETM